MKKLLKLSLLALMAVPALVGCSNNKKANPEETIKTETEAAFRDVGVAYAKFSSADGLGLAGATLTKECVTQNGFKFEFTYSLVASTDEYMLEYVKLQNDGLTLDVTIPEIWELPMDNQLFAVYTLTGKAKFVGYDKQDADYSSFVGQETGSKDWKIKVNAVEVRPVIEKISTVKKTHSDGDTVIIRGYVSGYYQKHENHFYTGVFVSDGPDSVMLYSGSLSNYVNQLEIGTLVQVIADWSAYNGLVELKPQSNGIAILKSDESIASPVVVDYTPAQFVDLKGGSSGNICKVEGLKLKTSSSDINALKVGEHWTLEAEASSKTITIYVNYHIGDAAMTAIKEKLIANYDKTFTFTGTVGFYNNPQLSPLISFATTDAPSCFQFAA